MSLTIGEAGRVTSASLTSDVGTTANMAVNAWVIKRKLLYNLIDEALAHGANNFERDIILHNTSLLTFTHRNMKDRTFTSVPWLLILPTI